MIDTPREVDYLMTTFDNKRNSFVNRHQSLRMCSLLGRGCAAILSSRLPRIREGSNEPSPCPYCANADIELVISQAGTTRAEALASLERNRWDLANSIMDLVE